MDPMSGAVKPFAGHPSLKDTVRLIADKGTPGTPPEDSLVKSAGDDPGLMPRMNTKLPKEAEFSYDGYETFAERHRCMIGSAIGGAVAGGITGGIIAYNGAMAIVNSKPVNTVNLEWNEPVMKDKLLGQMPDDYYEHNWGWGWASSTHVNSRTDMQNVVESAPVLGSDGKPVMQLHKNVWTEHGEPSVTWKDHTIGDPAMKGWSESTWEDTHTESDYVGTDSDGNSVYEDRTVVDGWRHTFSADIDYKTVGTYKTPSVHFETGVNVAGRTMLGVLAGMGAGAVSSALIGAGIEKVIRMREEKA